MNDPSSPGLRQRLAKWWGGEWVDGYSDSDIVFIGHVEHPWPRRALQWLKGHWLNAWKFYVGTAVTVALGVAGIVYK